MPQIKLFFHGVKTKTYKKKQKKILIWRRKKMNMNDEK